MVLLPLRRKVPGGSRGLKPAARYAKTITALPSPSKWVRAAVGAIAFFHALPSLTPAGMARFEPPSIEVNPSTIADDPLTRFVVSFSTEERASFVSVLFGSDTVSMVDFQWPYICDGLNCPEGPFITPYGPGIYPFEAYVGVPILRFVPMDLLGTLVADLSQLSPGVHEVVVDPDRDFGLSAANVGGRAEAIEGRLEIRVIPEPTCGMLLGAGVVLTALFRRPARRPSVLGEPRR
jgi:hypothetical protein